MHCNELSFQESLDCFDSDLENNYENNAWNLEHNVIKLATRNFKYNNARNYDHYYLSPTLLLLAACMISGH